MIVLDTHVWIWWVAQPEKLSDKARQEIDTAMNESRIHISSISCWEVSLLVRKGRLALTTKPEDWVAKSEALPFFRFEAVDNRIALASNTVSDLHDDPADRIIVATALVLGMPLVTKDRKIQGYPGVETVW